MQKNLNLVEKKEFLTTIRIYSENAVFIEHGITQSERLVKLNQIAIHQMSVWGSYENNYRLPLARLCVLQSIWQFSRVVSPPRLHAVTWSASISEGR